MRAKSSSKGMMTRRSTPVLQQAATLLSTVLLTCVTGCEPQASPDTPSKAQAVPSPSSQPTKEPSPQGVAREELPAEAVAPRSPADALARAVWAAAGGESLNRVAQIDFRFVVEENGEKVFEANHRWDRLGARDHVTWADSDGKLHDALLDLEARTACGRIDGRAPQGDALSTFSDAAYRRWVNDAYWLMVPLKVLDPGVNRAMGDRREWQGKRMSVLELSFDGVGLTPGDRYTLLVDDADRIVRWEMLLEGAEPPPRATSFEDYRKVGPLTLAHDHVTDDGTRRIRLVDVQVREELNAAAFEEIAGCAPEE